MRTEDGDIIRKCLDGDSAAFGLLVDKYKSSIYALAYSRLRNFHDAEDITQEVFIKAYKKLPTLRRWDNFFAWLYAITSNLCKDLIRSRSKRPDREFIVDQKPEICRLASMNSYQDELMRESLYEALTSLPEIYRQVLMLYYLGGMSSREIARFLGTSENNIDQRLSRGRTILKKEMLDMMSTTFEQQRLQPGFTFRLVEIVKRIKIKPATSKPLLPFGLSAAATGIVLTVLMFSPYLIPLTPLGALLSSPTPSETHVMNVGELPVSVLEISEITFLSGQQGDGDSGAQKPNPQNAFAPPLAPQAEGGTWTPKADMPTARYIPGSAVVDGKIYVIGGAHISHGATATVEEYDPETDTWTRHADMPTARQGVAAAAVDGIIYAIGGCDAGDRDLSTVEAYEPATNTWTTKADMPTPRNVPAIAVVDEIIYVISGVLDYAILSVVEAYDPTTDTWTTKADIPTAVWSSAGIACVIDGRIYVSGGATLWDPPFGILATVQVYDPATDTWTQAINMPRPRMVHSASVVDGKMYIIGGGDLSLRPIVDVYNPATDTWTTVADIPTSRGQHTACVVNRKIYVIGGNTGPGNAPLFIVEEYDPGLPGTISSVSPAGKLLETWGQIKRGQ